MFRSTNLINFPLGITVQFQILYRREILLVYQFITTRQQNTRQRCYYFWLRNIGHSLYQYWPGYRSIGEAVRMSVNTVRK